MAYLCQILLCNPAIAPRNRSAIGQLHCLAAFAGEEYDIAFFRYIDRPAYCLAAIRDNLKSITLFARDSLFNYIDDSRRRFGIGIIIGQDDDIRELMGDGSHFRTFRRISVASRPENKDDSARSPPVKEGRSEMLLTSS